MEIRLWFYFSLCFLTISGFICTFLPSKFKEFMSKDKYISFITFGMFIVISSMFIAHQRNNISMMAKILYIIIYGK